MNRLALSALFFLGACGTEPGGSVPAPELGVADRNKLGTWIMQGAPNN